MHEQEKRQESYLTLLLCYTFFLALLTVEALLLDWDMSVVLRLFLWLVACWVIFVSRRVPGELKKWLYFVMSMCAFFFFGIHETSFFDLAPVMIAVIIIYYVAGMYSMIRLCMAVYYVVMVYDLVFVFGKSFSYTPIMIFRILFHFVMVFLVGRILGHLVDKSDRERREMDMRIAELEDTNRRTEDFLTNVSHELRTPINAVTGLTTVMLKKRRNAQDRDNLLSIQQAGHRLFRQIEDILDFTEIDTGRVTLSEEDYMIASLVNDIISESRVMNNKQGLELIFDVDAGIPAVLHGDARKIKKIIKHLLDNAIKFTDKGGVCVRIYGLPKPYGINLCIRVTDTGTGMDKKSMEKIREKFYQSSGGRNRKAGGLGLGIPIVYGMASAMEGFAHVESREGSGTCVTVSIPQKVTDDTKCMKVDRRRELCLACYLRPEKYETPEVRKFYDEVITHIACELDVSVHRVFNMDELDSLARAYELTHLFVAKEEYEDDPDWFEALDEEVQVVLIGNEDYILPEGSRVKLLEKPFSAFPVVNILNTVPEEQEGEQAEKRMLCPGVRVLVVDDEPMNRMVAEGIFRDYRMEVETAESGRKAIEICGRKEFDLIFLDHMMPEMDGVETLKHLRRLKTGSSNSLTVIAFTANAVSGAREMFLGEGFDEFVPKPVETVELERVLRKVLPKSRIQYVDGSQLQEQIAQSDEELTENKKEPEDERQAGTKKTDEKKALKGKLAPFRELGINTKEGMTYCRGEESFYLQMLEMYAKEAEQKAEQLESLYAEKDYENYRIQVHSLKSTSRLLGADSIFEMAKNQETAAKESDLTYMEGHHEELLDAYRTLGGKFREILGIEEDFGPDHREEAAEEEASDEELPQGRVLSDEELFEQLELLQESLATYESDGAERILGELGETMWQGKRVKKLLREISRAMEQFDFEEAARKLTDLTKSLKEGEA